jgi:hypothetical protein
VFASPTLMVVFTIVFAATGLYSLLRFAALVSGAEADGDRVAELAHLVMSIAMIAMTWAFSGGPDTGSGILQIVVFGLIGLWFLTRVAGHGHGHGRVESAYHLVMAAAMVWMVAAMPVLMSGSGEVVSISAGKETHGDHGSMAGMDGMAGMHGTNGSTGMADMGAMAGPPSWARMVSFALVVLLVGAMALWASRLFRPAIPHPAPSEVEAPDPALPSAGTAVAVRPATPGLSQLTGPRLDAGCHLLMSVGMAGALLAML